MSRAQNPTDHELLTTKQKECDGTVETAIVRHVHVGSTRVTLTLSFDWTTDAEQLVYDLDSDRDVRKLEALTDARGFEFVQVEHLEGLPVEVQYAENEWVPTAHLVYAAGRGSVAETFRTELGLLARELARSPDFLRRFVRWTRTMTTKQLIVAVVLVKKLLVVVLLAWLLL